MNRFKTILGLLIASLCWTLVSKASNDTLTVGEVYNWKIGDSIVYNMGWSRDYETMNPSCQDAGGGGLIWYVVLDRQETVDSILYTLRTVQNSVVSLDLPYKDSSITHLKFIPLSCTDDGKWIPWLNLFTYPEADSLSILHSSWSSVAEDYGEVKFKKQLGLLYLQSAGISNSYNSGSCDFYYLYDYACSINLVYFESDSLEWIDSAFYFHTNIAEAITEPVFDVYPNPGGDLVIIKAISFYYTEDVMVKLTSMNGEEVYVDPWNDYNKETKTINLAELPKGVYVLSIEGRGEMLYRKKWIKQ